METKPMKASSTAQLAQARLESIAVGAIERSLGDVAAEYDSEEAAADAIYSEAYTLAVDALIDAGTKPESARRVADEVARRYAQP